MKLNVWKLSLISLVFLPWWGAATLLFVGVIFFAELIWPLLLALILDLAYGVPGQFSFFLLLSVVVAILVKHLAGRFLTLRS